MFAKLQHEISVTLDSLHNLCLERKVQLASAESCTGGLISSLLTAKSGSSAYFKGGVCSYSNEAKIKVLGVPDGLIRDHGAVSDAVARSMVERAQVLFASHFAVSVTGIAGPTGGSIEKPVGTVYIGFTGPGGTEVERRMFQGNRDEVRAQTCLFALAGFYQRVLTNTNEGVSP